MRRAAVKWACILGILSALVVTASAQTPAQLAAWEASAATLSGVSGWSLVRYLPAAATTWHFATDNLVGTQVYTSSQSSNNGWSVVFPVGFDEYFIMSADQTRWVYFPRSSLATLTTFEQRLVYSASSVAYPDSFLMYNRAAEDFDPVIACVKQTTNPVVDNLYAEARNTGSDPTKGSLVFVRTRAPCERRGEAETLTGMRDWMQIKHLPARLADNVLTTWFAGNTFKGTNGIVGTVTAGTRPAALAVTDLEWAVPFVPGPLTAGGVDYYLFLFRRNENVASKINVWVVYTSAQLATARSDNFLAPFSSDAYSQTASILQKLGMYWNVATSPTHPSIYMQDDLGVKFFYNEDTTTGWSGRQLWSSAVFHKRSPLPATPPVCCAAGGYASAGGCAICPAGQTSPAGAQAAAECSSAGVTCQSNAQQTADGSACVCNAGFEAGAGSALGTCAECAAGKYKAVSGNAACTPCPAHSISGQGGVGEGSCICAADTLSMAVSARVPPEVRARALVVEPSRAQLATLAGRETGVVDAKTLGTGWRLVRYLPPTSAVWYSGDDNLQGTSPRGTAYNKSSEWSLPFGEYDEFCFSTANFAHWLQCTRIAAIGKNGLGVSAMYGTESRDVMRSSANANPHRVTWRYRQGMSIDPMIAVSNLNSDLLYAESYWSGSGSLLQVHGGMNVWVRSNANKPAVSLTGGPGSGGMLTLDGAQEQFLDAGAHTFNIDSNGGFTMVAVVKFVGTPGLGQSLMDFGKSFSSDNIAIFRPASSTNLIFNIWDGGNACLIYMDNTVNQETWQTIVMTYNAVSLALTCTVDQRTQTRTCPRMADRTLTRTYVGKSNWHGEGLLHANIAGLFAVDALLSTAQIDGINASMHAGLDAQQVCRPCPAGRTIGAGLGGLNDVTCLLDCNANHHVLGTVCTLCPANSGSPAGRTALAACTCNAGFSGPNGGPCLLNCNVNHYVVGTVCTPCPANSGSPAGRTALAACTCNAGFSGPSGGPCVCNNNTYLVGTICTPCPTNSGSLAGSTLVTDCVCKAGSSGPNGGPCSPSCNANDYLVGMVCNPCPANSGSLAGSAVITDCICSAGFSGLNGGPCLPNCDDDHYWSGTMCTPCPVNSGSPPGRAGLDACTCNNGFGSTNGGPCECIADSYLNGKNCFPCPLDSSSLAGSTSFADCFCNNNFWGPGDFGCVKCPSNTGSLAGSTAVTDCACGEGFWGPGGGTCTPCSVVTRNVTCTGPCACTPTTTDFSGVITDGPGDYANNMECEYLLVSNSIIHLEFTLFETESEYDFITIELCTQPQCGVSTRLYHNSGKPNLPIVFSTNVTYPVMRVIFEADEHVRSKGFDAKWLISAVPECACGVDKYRDVRCETCPQGSESPGDALGLTSCRCKAGYSGPDGGACTQCLRDQYKPDTGSSSCVYCPLRSSSLPGSAALTSCTCSTGSVDPNGGPCLCNVNTYEFDQICTPCPTNSSSIEGSTDVSDCVCNAGFVRVNGGLCVPGCDYDYYSVGVICTPCPANSASPVGSTVVTDCVCMAGFSGLNGGPCSYQCDANDYKAGIFCAECPLDSSSLAGSTAITDCVCNEDFWGPNGGNCAQCPSDTGSLAGSTAVTDCACDEGFWGPGGGTCTPCSSVTRSVTCTGTCACTPTTTDSSGVITDGPGDYVNLMKCGYLLVSNDIINLEFTLFDTESSYDFITIELCTQPQCGVFTRLYHNSGKPNLPLVFSTSVNYPVMRVTFAADDIIPGVGFYANWSLSTAPQCTCGVNQYRDVTCKNCPQGSESPKGSSSLTSCRCKAGYSGPDGGTCTQCLRNEYKPGTGSSSCTPCPPRSGSLPGSAALTSCTCNTGSAGPDGGPCVCNVNSYSFGGTCIPCTANSSSIAGSTVATACICNAGFVRVNGADVCTPCPTNSGSIAGSTVMTACICNAGFSGPNGGPCIVDCKANHYVLNAVCTRCPENSGSPAGRTALSSCTCNTGFLRPSGGTCTRTCAVDEYRDLECENCPAGSESPASSFGLQSCLCKAGYAGPDGGPCTPCSSGTYMAGRNSSICLDCPGNSFSPVGSAAPAACRCNAGSSGADGGPCTLCSGGTYKSDTGSSNCVGCPVNSLSNEGSTDITDCVCNAGFSGDDGGTCSPCSGVTRSVTCTGTCPCTPTTTNNSGVITDGPNNYVNNMDCQWILTSNIQINFQLTFMATEDGWDHVTIELCTNPQCGVPTQLYRNSGTPDNLPIVLSTNVNTPVMRVLFKSDYINSDQGFNANWFLSGPDPGCPRPPCAVDQYRDLKCKNCPEGSESPENSLSLMSCLCRVGYTGANGGPCSICPEGTKKPALGNGNCHSCPPLSNYTAEGTCACEPGTTAVQTNVARACDGAPGGVCVVTMLNPHVHAPATLGNNGRYDSGSDPVVSSVSGLNVFTIDLQHHRQVSSVRFWNRVSCCQDRSVGAAIRIGSSPLWSDNAQCATLTDALEQTYTCDLGGRYVFLVQQSGVMNFMELEVFTSTCTACAANTYKAGQGNAACDQCPTHSTSLARSCAEEQCHCDAGFRKHGALCVQCDADTFRAPL